MRVILTTNVADLGGKGDVVEVADGYARNYLVPRSLAVKATPGSMQQAEKMRAARDEVARREKEAAEVLGQTLVGTRVVVAARAGDEGRLFGSIGAADIAEAIRKFTGIELDQHIVHIESPIKEIGLHQVAVRPHPEVEIDLILDVIPA